MKICTAKTKCMRTYGCDSQRAKIMLGTKIIEQVSKQSI
jgi:hypothetical protein